MTTNSEIRRAFMPTSKLRAAINLGNPILANRHPTTREPVGVSVDLAKVLARRLGVPLELVTFDAALKSVEAVSTEQADFGFFAVDPGRGASIAFTKPYVLIEGFYLVRENSPVQCNEDVDHEHNRVVVGKGSAYELFLSRQLKAARIVRTPTSQEVVQTFINDALEVAAGVRQQLESDAKTVSGLRLLPERFMVIQQAMGLPKTRGQDAADYLCRFVEDMKSSGFVARSLANHGVPGASVAP
jgi:polar amino acid transport system substrate-binding protein